jgi:F-type H+-transporting ATPase subunit b
LTQHLSVNGRRALGIGALRVVFICGALGLVSARASGEQSHAAGQQPHAPRDHSAAVPPGETHDGAGHVAEHSGAPHGAEHHLDINWFDGFIGVKEGVKPSLLWRAPGTPAPFGAMLLNTLLLVGIIVKVAKAPVARGLRERRQRIMRGIDEAAAMKQEATLQLAMYRDKLANLDAEIERIRGEMRASAELERQRILQEASVRSARLEQEARLLVEQELKGLREELTRETTLAALRSARELLKINTSTEDHRRLCEQYLQSLPGKGPKRGERSEST